MKTIAIISTGGTIEKTYNKLEGKLHNTISILDVILDNLELGDLQLKRFSLMNKDSSTMTAKDHSIIANKILEECHNFDGIIIVHGTDSLEYSGNEIYQKNINPSCPIIFTGAMVPYMFRDTDAIQNVTEALISIQILKPGIYVVMQNRILQFPGVTKDKDKLVFIKN